MAQRKKKPSGHQLQAIAKAHHKNEFLRKLKYICNCCCGKDIYSLLPRKEFESIYSIRYHTFKIVPAKGNVVPGKVLSNIKDLLLYHIKKCKLEIPDYGIEISLEDFFTVGLTLQGYSKRIKDDSFPHADQVILALQNFGIEEKMFEDGFMKLQHILSITGCWETTIGGYLYWICHDVKLAGVGRSVNNILEIHTQKPESTRIKMNGTVRPIVRLGSGMSNNGVKWTTLQPSLLNIKNGSKELPLNVYVQSHTLLRMNERIDCIDTSLMHMDVILSFEDARVFYDNNKNILIEYRILGCKAGYFRVDIVDGIAVVRTFLFVTQSGTPEGQLLWKNTGLQKLDTKYLALDKLSSFMSSDIGNNERVRKILQDSGCQCLLDLYSIINDVCTKYPSQSTSNLMLDYLGVNEASAKETITAE